MTFFEMAGRCIPHNEIVMHSKLIVTKYVFTPKKISCGFKNMVQRKM